MKLHWLIAGVVLGQEEYSDYPDYAYEYNNGARPGPPTTSGATTDGTTTGATTGDYTTTEAPSTDAPTVADAADYEPGMANDFVPVAEEVAEEPEEVEEGAEAASDVAGLGRMNMDQFWYPVGKNENAGSAVYVNPVSRLDGELLADGDIQLTWDVDATHKQFTFEFQAIQGNYEAVSDYASLANVALGYNSDNTKAVATFTPGDTKTIYRIRIVAQDKDTNGGACESPDCNSSDPAEINVQSATDELTHQPGSIYTGNSGFAGQILLINDFTHASYMKTDTNDNVGYVTAVKVTFPAGCTYPTFRIDSDLDQAYIYTDDSISAPHRIFIFPQTHFSNALGGPVKAFHYYVSNMYGCVTDPTDTSQIQVETALEYISRTTLNVDGTTGAGTNITVTAMWPSDGAYPPVQFTEQHIVWFDTLIQQATHLGPSLALGPPRVSFSTGSCQVYLNIAEETDSAGAGYSTGWGYLTTYNSQLQMTDLFSNPGTTNYGTSFVFQALEWLNHIGVTFRFDSSSADCLTIASTGTVTYLTLDTTTYSLTRVPDQNAINAMNNGK
jgi:hypothetical protein